jgi:hypothetical protein
MCVLCHQRKKKLRQDSFTGEIFKLIVFEQVRASRCVMETRVLVLRVLRDGSTSVVVQVLHSNAVLTCEMTKNSTTKLEPGKIATIRVHALEFPIMRVSILVDDSAGARMHSARMYDKSRDR